MQSVWRFGFSGCIYIPKLMIATSNVYVPILFPFLVSEYEAGRCIDLSGLHHWCLSGLSLGKSTVVLKTSTHIHLH